MSDQVAVTNVPVSDPAKQALADLEKQIKGIEDMMPGARAAGMDTRNMEATVAGLKAAVASIKSIPGTT